MDYALVASLLTLSVAFGFSKAVKELYRAEALTLPGYIAVTDHSTTVKPVMPFSVHGNIDPLNAATFALQSFLSIFQKDKKALTFNIIFTVALGITVLLTDYDSKKTKASDL